jgi:competence protein ComEA
MQSTVLSRRNVLLGLLLLALLVLVGLRVLSRPHHAADTAIPPIVGAGQPAGGAGAPAARAARVVVDVVGAVRRPGLYRLPDGSRVADAIARAGGLSRRADRAGVNLAAPVADGEQIVVPALLPRAVAGAEGAPAAGAGSPPATAPVQLSTATVEQLDTLPGIGPVTAQKIVAYRAEHGAFHSVDELDEVPGIGPARVEQLRGLVVP